MLKDNIRPIVAGLFAVTTCYGFVTQLIKPGEFLPIVAMIIGFYYQSREKTNGK
jgi:hypothetical protein